MAIARQGENAIIVPLKNKSKVISLKIDEITLHILDVLSWKLKISRSELIRLLIKGFIYLVDKAGIDEDGMVIDLMINRDGEYYKVSIDLNKEALLVNM